MPPTSALLAFAASAFAIIIIPGPSVLFVVSRAVAHGRRAAVLTVFGNAGGAYTQALLAEVPRIDRKKRTYVPIKGEIPSPLAPPSGCHFHPRCPLFLGTTNAALQSACLTQYPPSRRSSPRHWARCHAVEGEVVTNV